MTPTSSPGSGTPITEACGRPWRGLALLLALLGGCSAAPVDPDPTPPPSDDDDSVADDDDATPADDDDATPPAEDVLVINEVLASAAPGASPGVDWIELHNPGDTTVSLAGWALRDAPVSEPASPLDASLQVEAGGYLVLLADGAPELGPTHLPLRLSVDGDRLQLLHDDAVVDDVDFGELLRGWSLARNGDGSHDWEVRGVPTPGATNVVGSPALPATDDPRLCLPRDEDPRHVVEGEAFVAELHCDGDPLDRFRLTVVGDVGAGTWDAASATWTLPTDLDDAGRHEILFVLKPDDSGGVPETERAAVNVVDAWGEPDNVPPDPAAYWQEWGLPVLHLDPSGPLTQSDIATTAWFDGTEYSAEMKIRGASSAGYPKNSFTVEFEPTQIDLRDHGLGRKDHLILISNFDDAAYVRQKLVFDVWAEIAATREASRLTPRTAWVVVYLDGAYHGLYTAIDRVDDEFIGELDWTDTGNLYKSVNHDANYSLLNNNGSVKSNLAAGWEKKEGPDDDMSDLVALTQWAGEATPAVLAAEHSDWISMPEFFDWWALVVHLSAGDSAAKNAYLYNDPDGTGFRYVPWDFNHSLGQNWRTLRVGADSYNDFANRNRIFELIQADPTLSEQLWAAYADLLAPGAPLSAVRLQELVAESYAAIDLSAERDWARWGDEHRNYGGWRDLRGGAAAIDGYPEERAYLEQWIDDREVAAAAWGPSP